MVIAVINNKGGTGKTTTCANLAAAFALSGHRVLLVDLDSQASASVSLGIRWADLSPSSADLLFDQAGVHDLIRPSEIPGLDLITAEMDLASADLILADLPGREVRLKNGLEPIRDQYDFILCDCPPSLSLLSVNALMAADAYVVPVTAEYLALEGLVSLTDAVNRLSRSMDMSADFLGIVFTLINPSVKSAREIIDLVREHYGPLVFETEIKRDARLSEAPSFSKSVFEFAPKSNGAKAYKALAQEMLKRCRPYLPAPATAFGSAQAAGGKKVISGDRPQRVLKPRRSI
jgi:chromosome partitioning protein